MHNKKNSQSWKSSFDYDNLYRFLCLFMFLRYDCLIVQVKDCLNRVKNEEEQEESSFWVWMHKNVIFDCGVEQNQIELAFLLTTVDIFWFLMIF